MQGTIQLHRAQQGLGGQLPQKIQGCANSKAEATSCGFSVWNEGRCLYSRIRLLLKRQKWSNIFPILHKI